MTPRAQVSAKTKILLALWVTASPALFAADALKIPLQFPTLEKHDNWQQSLEDLESTGIPRTWEIYGPIQDQNFKTFEREDGEADQNNWAKLKTKFWTRPPEENDAFVDFADLVGGRFDSLGYAMAEVDWPLDGPALIWFDSVGRGAVYLNNTKIASISSRKRSTDPGKESMYPIAVEMKRGRNFIRVKVEQERGVKGFGFSLRLERDDFDFRRQLFEKLNSFYPQEGADFRGGLMLLELARKCEREQNYEAALMLYTRVAEKYRNLPLILASLRNDLFVEADEGCRRCQRHEQIQNTQIDQAWKTIENQVHSLLLESDARGADNALRDFIARYPFHDGAGIALAIRGGLRQDYFQAESCAPFFERALREFGRIEFVRLTCLRGLSFARSFRPEKADIPVKHELQQVLDGVRRQLSSGVPDDMQAAMKKLGEIVREQQDSLLCISDSQAFPRYAGLCEYIRALLSQLKPEFRAVYQATTKDAAEERYRAALEMRNLRELEATVWQFYYTPAAAKSLNQLGNLHADRGAWAQAAYAFNLVLCDFAEFLPQDAGSELPTRAALTAKLSHALLMNGETAEAHKKLDALASDFASTEISFAGAKMSCAAVSRILSEQLKQPAGTNQFTAHQKPGAVLYSQPVPRSASTIAARQFWPEDKFYAHYQSNPVVRDNRAFITTLESIQCLDLTSGKTIWRDNWDSSGTLFPERFTGFPTSSPTVAEGRVMMRALRGQYTSLRCYNSEDGQLVWSTDRKPELKKMVWLSDPAIAYGLAIGVFLESPQQLAIEPPGSTATNVHGVAAFDLETGELIWKRTLGSGITGIRVVEKTFGRDKLWATYRSSMQLGAPAAQDGVIYAETGLGSLAALNAFTGQVVWIAGYPRLRAESLEGGNSGIDLFWPRVLKIIARGAASPVVSPDTIVLAPKDAPGMIAFDRRNGAIRWINELMDSRYIAGVCGNNLLVADENICAISLKNGDVAWDTKLGITGKTRALLGKPAYDGKALFLPTIEGIRMVDAQTGKLLENLPWDQKYKPVGNLVTDGKYFAGASSDSAVIFGIKN